MMRSNELIPATSRRERMRPLHRISRAKANDGGPWYDVTSLPFEGILHDVNDGGEYAGQYQATCGATHAVYVRASAVIDLGTLGGTSSSARAINNEGIVVGGALTHSDEEHHAFVYVNGVMYDLNTRINANGIELLQALGINDRGEIVAIADHAGSDRLVLLTPRPRRTSRRLPSPLET
jgi:probable HAF family extracellular repeat protein